MEILATQSGQTEDPAPERAAPPDTVGMLGVLLRHWRAIAVITIAAGALGYGLTAWIPPTFTARTTFLSPQQQQNSAAAALASLGALSGLGGAAAGVKSPSDQYVALMQSVTLSQRIIERFELDRVYKKKLRADTLEELRTKVRLAAGKKDSLISVEVDDDEPQRAADMANAYVEELRKLANRLALTDAQQRRVFFEQQLEASRHALAQAQSKLQGSGFNLGALKNEPKAAAEGYAKLKAEIAAAEIRLTALRQRMTDGATEVQEATSGLVTMRTQLSRMEAPGATANGDDYIGAYRDYKYQEALFDVYSRQFELARIDEARDGTLLQTVDVATPPERQSKPRRSQVTLVSAAAALVLSSLVFWLRHRISSVRRS